LVIFQILGIEDPDKPIRKIIHIDMDAFYASIEQRDFPEYKNKPLVVGGASKRGVVAAASYEARKYGIRSAMPTLTAVKRFPELIIVRPRFNIYKQVSKQIMEVFHSITDLVEPLSLDEAFLDVTRNTMDQSSATIIAKEIKLRIKDKTELTASAGVSVNKFLAKIASDMDKPDGLYVIKPNEVEAFINELPVEKFFGVGKVTARRMQQQGIFKGNDLKQKNLADLIRLFGKNGNFFYEICRGIDNRPVNPERIRKSFGKERTFEEDLTNLDDIHSTLQDITDMLWHDLLRTSVKGKTLTIKIKYADFQQITRSKTFSREVESDDQIFSTAKEVLNSVFVQGNRIRLLGITLSNLTQPEHDDHSDNNQLSFDFN
jgi:DNA polymerase-4